jgi:hypothetical protein
MNSERKISSIFFRICKFIFYICTVLKESHLLSQQIDSIALKLLLLRLLGPDGGIGRRAGLKHLWETVPVRLRLRVQKPLRKKGLFFLILFLMGNKWRSHTFKVRLWLRVQKPLRKKGLFFLIWLKQPDCI